MNIPAGDDALPLQYEVVMRSDYGGCQVSQGMVTWADADAAVATQRQLRVKRVESITTLTALLILACAIWLAWPSLDALISGRGVALSSFGAPTLLLVWGIILQDVALDDPSARSRIGATASIAWPVLGVLGALSLETTLNSGTIGGILIFFVAWICRRESRQYLRGSFGVLRFRAMMTGIGTASSSVFLFNQFDVITSGLTVLAPIIVLGALVDTIHTWVVGDDQKAMRKAFKRRLDELEQRLLELKAQGAAVDQAASLLTTAREEGHLDPVYGMRLLDDSEEDMNRSISLADDVEIIRQDALKAVEDAEDVAPTAKRPRRAYDMGEREVALGSLREGELLFRESKKRAQEINEWWAEAEQAIAEGTRLLDGKKGDGIARLHELLAEARELLASEKPREAFEYASTVPAQFAADGDAQERADDAIEEAKRQLKQTDGLDTDEMEQRLAQAEEALEAGHASQAIGLADGIVRTISKERAAMDDVLRALKQRKQLVKRFEGRDDADDWRTALSEIEVAVEDRNWSHAGMLLEQMTASLDREGKAGDEALELYDFVMEEWRVLRNQCETANIDLKDEDRRACEQAIALAEEMLGVSRIEDCLVHLSEADSAMERLRRRI